MNGQRATTRRPRARTSSRAFEASAPTKALTLERGVDLRVQEGDHAWCQLVLGVGHELAVEAAFELVLLGVVGDDEVGGGFGHGVTVARPGLSLPPWSRSVDGIAAARHAPGPRPMDAAGAGP